MCQWREGVYGTARWIYSAELNRHTIYKYIRVHNDGQASFIEDERKCDGRGAEEGNS